MAVFTYADPPFLTTTSNSLDGIPVKEYRGVIISDVTIGRHIGRDILSGVRDLFGGRSRSWETSLVKAQQQAMQELVEEARRRGANAVLGMHVEDEAIGAKGSMINVKVFGTAVLV